MSLTADRSVGTAVPGRRRPRARTIALGAAGLGLVATGWLAFTGWQAKAELEQVRASVEQARAQVAAGDVAGARVSADRLAAHARRAHHLTGGPLWALAGAVPYAGDPVHSVRIIAAAADRLGRDAVPRLLGVGEQLDPATVRRDDGTIEIGRIAAALPALEEAATALTAALDDVRALPASTWLAPLDAARAELVEQLASVSGEVDSARLAAGLLPPMLGADGARNYLLVFQNDAEARGTGGLPGAFAALRAKGGKISFTRFGTDDLLQGTPSDVDLPKEFDEIYTSAPRRLYGNGNASPHYPYAARIWASMWKNRTGQKVDGVLAVDPTVLSYLLDATGPARLPDGSTVTSANIVDLTQRQAYARFGTDTLARKQYLVELAQASSAHVMAGHVDPTKLVQALSRAAGERRLLVWAADRALQAEIASTQLGGVIPQTTSSYAGLVIDNEAGNKLDYYLDRSITWERTGCGVFRDVMATVRLTNNAPATGLSAWVTNRGDKPEHKTKPGDNRLMVHYFATSGAVLRSLTVDGKPAPIGSGSERGHPVFRHELELPRGATRTLVFHLSEPASADGPVEVLRQPLVRPLSVTVHDEECR